jgi:hypothetical protein
MRCAWREVASYIDVLHLPLFLACLFFLFWLFFFVERPWRKAEYGRWWWLVPRSLTREQRQSFEQRQRDAGLGWFLAGRGRAIAVYVAFLVVVFWPFLSPTYCENVVCKGHKGQFKPRTECLPQNAARRDGSRAKMA